MSITLPPTTGNAVALHFVYPYDSDMPKELRLAWRKTIHDHHLDHDYATIRQHGDHAVAHEQLTFPGDEWVVKHPTTQQVLLAYVASAEREQRVIISAAAAASASSSSLSTSSGGRALGSAAAVAVAAAAAAADDEEEQVARAIALSLQERNGGPSAPRVSSPPPALSVRAARPDALLKGAHTQAGAVELSRKVAEAARLASRIDDATALYMASDAACESVRLLLVMPDGQSREPLRVSASAPLRQSLVAVSRSALVAHHGLAWLAERMCAPAADAPTHSLISSPELRIDFCCATDEKSSSEDDSCDDLRALAPAARLRLSRLDT